MRSVVSARSGIAARSSRDEREVALARVGAAHRLEDPASSRTGAAGARARRPPRTRPSPRSRGSRKSFGCGLVKRIRSMPSTASHGAQQLAELGARSPGARSRPHELTFWPSSVTSRTPSAASRVDLGDDLARPAALLAAAHGRDDAVGARRVAAHRDLHPGLERPLAARRQVAGERALHVARSRPRDADAAGAEPVAEVRDRARARTRRRRTGTARRAARAAPRRSSRRPRSRAPGRARFSALRLREVRGEPLVGLLADRAGVEDDHVRLVLATAPRRGRAPRACP